MATLTKEQIEHDNALKTNIISILERESMLALDISKELGISVQKANGLLGSLEDKGLVEHTLVRVQGNLRKVYRLIDQS